MNDLPSRLVRIEEQTKHIKQTVDDLAILLRVQADNNSNAKIELAKMGVRIDAIDVKLARMEPSIPTVANASTQKTTVVSTAFATTATAVLIAIMEYFRR